MQATDFPESNRALTAPAGMEETVHTLHVYNDGQQSVSCWQPSDAERAAIAAGGPVWLGVVAGASAPPVWVCGLKPYMPPVVHEPSEKYLQALAAFAQVLPPPSEVSKGLRSVAELLKEYPDLPNVEALVLNPEGLTYLVDHASQLEHYAALVEAYRQGGQPAVVEYLRPYEAFIAFHQPR